MAISYSGSRATPRLEIGEALKEYIWASDSLIAPVCLPALPVNRRDASYAKLTRESMLELDQNLRRAAGSAYSRGHFSPEDGSYACKEYGHEVVVDRGEQSFYAPDFDADMVAAEMAMGKVLLGREKIVADKVFNTTTFTGSDLYTDVSTVWSDAGATIIGDVQAAKEEIRQNTGLIADSLIIGAANLQYLRKNTQLINAFVGVPVLTDDLFISQLASILGLRRVVVGRAVYNTAGEGAAFTGGNVWSSSYAMVAKLANPGQSLSEPCLGRMFVWDSPSEAPMAEEYDDVSKNSRVMRSRLWFDAQIIEPYCGHLLKID